MSSASLWRRPTSPGNGESPSEYKAVDPVKAQALSDADQEAITSLTAKASQKALATSAIFPAVMLFGYIALFVFFRRQGGYKTVELQ